MLVGEGEAERRGVHLREEGAVGLPEETREAVRRKVGAGWRGGGRGEGAEHSGSANKACSPGSRLWQAACGCDLVGGVKIGGEGDSGASGGP